LYAFLGHLFKHGSTNAAQASCEIEGISASIDPNGSRMPLYNLLWITLHATEIQTVATGNAFKRRMGCDPYRVTSGFQAPPERD
jgi:hypothetical protein